MKKFTLSAAVVALSVAPMFASAQQYFSNVAGLIRSVGTLVSLALPVVVGIALLAFFYGLVKFIFSGGDQAKHSEAVKLMLYGIIALFVMVSVWGLVRFVGSTIGVSPDGGSAITPPTVQGL